VARLRLCGGLRVQKWRLASGSHSAHGWPSVPHSVSEMVRTRPGMFAEAFREVAVQLWAVVRATRSVRGRAGEVPCVG